MNEENERYYSVIDCNGNFELRDYECGKTIHSLFELDDLLNRQDARIKELEDMVVKKQNKLYSRLDEIKNLQEEKQQLKIDNGSLNEIVLILIEQLKQSQKQLAIEELEKLRPLITRQTYICGGKATENEIVKANAYNRCLADIRDILDNQT